jgi:thiamine-phosphate diphosphorylase
MTSMTNIFSHTGIYAVVDSVIHEAYGLSKLLQNIALESEIPVIQLRLKKMSMDVKKQLVTFGIELKRKREFKLILNDDIELLSNENIDGLHLGQKDFAFGMARQAYPKRILGISTHSVEEAQKAVAEHADYIGCGAVYPTTSKENTTPLGLDNLKEIVQAVSIPVVAIGGITAERINDIAQTKCNMAAVMSGLTINGRFSGSKLHEMFINARSR